MWTVPLRQHPDLAFHVILNMRAWDRREIFATRVTDDNVEFLDAVLATGDLAWLSGRDAEPIAAYGCAPLWPGVWSMWMFATDEFGRIGLSMTKAVKNRIVPGLIEAGAHRMECRSMEGHVEAQRWLEALGAEREATLAGYGRDREDFHVYVWSA